MRNKRKALFIMVSCICLLLVACGASKLKTESVTGKQTTADKSEEVTVDELTTE